MRVRNSRLGQGIWRSINPKGIPHDRPVRREDVGRLGFLEAAKDKYKTRVLDQEMARRKSQYYDDVRKAARWHRYDDYWCHMIEDVSVIYPFGDGGRIYFNLKEGHAVDFARLFVKEVVIPNKKIISHFKVTHQLEHINDHSDDSVIYFPKIYEGEILEQVEAFYRRHSYMFKDGVAAMTGQLYDSRGHMMRGISFAQEPRVDHKESFNGAMEEIIGGLADKIVSMLNEGRQLTWADVESMAILHLRNRGWDPSRPYIKSDSIEHFPKIIARTAPAGAEGPRPAWRGGYVPLEEASVYYEGTVHRLYEAGKETVVGRGREADIAINGSYDGISRKHIGIQYLGNRRIRITNHSGSGRVTFGKEILNPGESYVTTLGKDSLLAVNFEGGQNMRQIIIGSLPGLRKTPLPIRTIME